MMKFPNWRDAGFWTLAIVPVALLILSRIFVHMVGSFEADPDYAYLFNGLEMLTLHPPSYFDHPGTTVEVLAALVCLIAWLVSLPFHMVGLVTDVLTRPEFYLEVINKVMAMAIAVAAFWFGDCVRRATSSVTAALAGQASLLLSFSAMIALDRVTPEPLLLASTLVLAGLLVPFAFGTAENSRPQAMAVGIALGFAIATKITALPLIPVLLFLPNGQLRKRAAWCAAAAFFFCTLPVAIHYPQMFGWIFRLFTHSGAYGDGAAGAPSVAMLWTNFAALLGQTPELFVALALYAVASLLGPAPLRRFVGIAALVVAAQIVMVLKQPEPRYLTPAIAIFALANAGLFFHAHGRIAGAILTALMLVGLWNNGGAATAWARESHAAHDSNHALLDRAASTGCALVSYYEAPFLAYELDFGNQFTNYRFKSALQRLYPTGMTYDVFRRNFMFFGTALSPSELRARPGAARCIVLVGSPVERYGKDFGIPDSALTLLGRTNFSHSRSLAMYRLDPGL